MTPEIVFPTGFGGNHVRWLLSIDPAFDLPFCQGTVADKVDWILKNVYTKRTWNNWLHKESKFRDRLDTIIKVEHFLTQPGEMFYHSEWQDKKQLLLIANDPTMASYHYFMINLGLNNQTKSTIINQFNQWTKLVDTIRQNNFSNKQILVSDCITNSTLDYEWYKTVINWVGYSDLYSEASFIQKAYYQCRQQAANDFVEYFEGKEFQTHLNFYKTTYIGR